MSQNQQLIINCGASRVTAAKVTPSASNLQIDRLVTVPLNYDFSEDESWLSAVASALHELSHQHGFSGRASFIIPGNQVLTKTIRIPHVEAGKRAQIIAFEAQQNIPYPLHEVVWDSQVVGDDGVETEVLFIACKSDTINSFCSSISAAGFVPEKISAATILDYNAIQFAYPELDDDVLLVNVGARSTNLLFRNPDGFFVRNIQLGGNSLTQNIADSLGKSFSEAEEIKRSFFGGESSYDADDSGAKLLNTSADSFTRRTSQEITRSIVNYRRQKSAGAPKRILLSGRGSLLKGLNEQLSSGQKMPVEFFDTLQNVTLDQGVEGDPESLRLEISEIVGLAAVPFVPNGAEVDLLPDAIQSEIAFKSKKPALIAAFLLLALAPWPAYVGFKQLSSGYEEKARAVSRELGPLQNRQAEIAGNTERAAEIGASIQRVEGLVNSKTNWIQFFAELQKSLSLVEDVWLDGLSVERELAAEGGEPTYEIVVSGQMLVRESAETNSVDQSIISPRIKSLQSSFEGSEFILASKSPKINWQSLRNGFNVLPFTINLVVDPARPL
ncbi:MAG: pilus assembly protein PilM [Opitutales bacterium]